MSTKIILFELNEVPWRVLEDHMRERPSGALARLAQRARTYETFAEEADLSPWITWASLHRGVSESHHSITDFNQDLDEINAAYPSIWELLSRQGVSVGVCGSVHSNPCPANPEQYSFFIPDPFARDKRCWPPVLEAFQEFNLCMSRKSARNVSSRIEWQKLGGVLKSVSKIGLRPSTFAGLARQLADERLRKWTKVRRRTYQSLLVFDVYMTQLERSQPAFSTFFTNHVASTMHRFWAARYPKDYESFDCSDAWVETYGNELRWVLERADQMLARLESFTARHPEYEIWITSSMGQQATEARRAYSQVYLKQLEVFLARLGVEPGSWHERPAMAPRAIFALDGGRDQAFEARLDCIEIAARGKLAWQHLGAGVYRIHPGVHKDVRPDLAQITYEGRRLPFAEFGFQNLMLEDQVGQTAYHIPEGILLKVGSQVASGSRESISTQEIAPMILDQFGLPRPGYMAGAARRPSLQVA